MVKKKPLQPVSLAKKEKRQSEKEVVLITDLTQQQTQQQTQLKDMIQRFCSVMPAKIKIVNLREYPFKGGCMNKAKATPISLQATLNMGVARYFLHLSWLRCEK